MNSFNFMKKSTEELKQDLLDKECGVVGQWQDYPTNWEQEQDADQRELAELNKKEFQKEQDDLMRDELKRDEEPEQDAWRDAGMSWSDFL
jgi:hypothetical protein